MSIVYRGNGHCAICKKSDLLVALHDERGGPSVCLICAGKWHAEHGRRRKAGRVAIRALQAYNDAGGKWGDIDKLKLCAIGCYDNIGLDPLGYMTDAINTHGENVDLTLELLDDIIRLGHPDRHPPERQDLAKRVTQSLVALRPFVFPAPKPKAPRNESLKCASEPFKEPLRPTMVYPCKECADAIPYHYCNTCRAEFEKRAAEKQAKENAKQRKWYAQRKATRMRFLPRCPQCGVAFKGKRKDARFCSNTCRQAAHRSKRATRQFKEAAE